MRDTEIYFWNVKMADNKLRSVSFHNHLVARGAISTLTEGGDVMNTTPWAGDYTRPALVARRFTHQSRNPPQLVKKRGALFTAGSG